MKIGLITIHFVSNLGAVLQAYATQTYLSRFGQVEIIDYRHNSGRVAATTLWTKLRRQWSRLQTFLHPLRLWRAKKRVRLCTDFRTRYLHLSPQSYRGDGAILKQPPQYDVYITGSDQIWNTSITHNSKAYFLHFTQSPNKYAFSSSIGHENITEEEKRLICAYLPGFKQIAVREEESAWELQKLLNRPVVTVLDPVFLLSPKEWEPLMESVKLPKGEFVAVYIMEKNKAIKNIVRQLKRLGLPLVFIGEKSLAGFGAQIPCVSPQEFLYILSKAKYVVTNSFHGFAFGLIFKKQIFVAEHASRNLRLSNLLERIDAADKQIYADTPDIFSCQVDGAEAYSKLDIQRGKDYLAGIFASYNTRP